MQPAVTYVNTQGVGCLTLCRPANRNSMTEELLLAFEQALAVALADPSLRCLVVTGTGASFCAGADFRAMASRPGSGRLPHEASYAMYAPFLRLLEVPVPVIAALNGHAVGGGFGLALLCDLRLGNRDAKFGANFVRLGLSPGMGLTRTLPALIGHAPAMRLMLSGDLISGTAAAALGLLEAVEAAEVVPQAMALAATLASNAPLAMRGTKALLRHTQPAEIRAAAAAEAHWQAQCLVTADAQEGIAALLGKRVPRFTGA